MSKYSKVTSGQKEALINIVGGVENMKRILRGESSVSVNTAYPELRAIWIRYDSKMRNAGAIIQCEKSFGIRDIVLPLEAFGGEEEQYEEMKRVIQAHGVRINESGFFSHPLRQAKGKAKIAYVSLRNTLEHSKDKDYVHYVGFSSLSCLGLFCLTARYFDVFFEDWFGDHPSILPVGGVAHYTVGGGDWCLVPDRSFSSPTVTFQKMDTNPSVWPGSWIMV